MNVDEIFVNGDSFSALHQEPRSIPGKLKVYSEWLQDFSGCTVKNHAVPGSSNDRIIRTTLNHCLLSRESGKNLFVIIGLSYFSREELWYPALSKQHLPAADYWDSAAPSSFATLDTILKHGDPPDEVKYATLLIERNRQLIHTMTKLFMLTATLKNLNHRYVIFTGPRQDNMFHPDVGYDRSYLNQLPLWQALKQDCDIIDLVTWSLSDWGKQNDPGQSGTHLRTEGHEKFARYLMDRYAIGI